MIFNHRLYDLIDKIVHKLPPPILRVLGIPVLYLEASDGLYQNAQMIFTAIGYVANNKIEGDYAEFGVYRGQGIIEAYYAARKFALGDMRFWAFDSFKGLPEIKGYDRGGEFTTGEFSCSRPEFDRNLKRYNVDTHRVHTVEGFFDESLRRANETYPEQIAIAWIDCDLYESTVPVLEFLTSRLVDGAVLVFDDWFCFRGRPDKGEQLACAEWLRRNPRVMLTEYRSYHWAGKSFLVHRR